MDKNSIKKYAVWARRELISRVNQKALQYGVSEKEIVDANADTINGHLLTNNEKKQRQALITRIKQIGHQQTMEEAAYTWFNRFSALRFMEVNGYLPTHVRVFTDEQNAFKPQILAEAIHLELDGLNIEKVYELKDANRTDELYKYLLITQCNALSAILPGMFTRIEDYTELLFPDNLLREGSVIEQMISIIPEDNFDISTENGQFEIIGWLYQYYISEKHEEVVDPLHGKIVKKEEVPAATQLFTTDWVVRYIIDNSVGRYWIERNPNSALKEDLKYYIPTQGGNSITEKETIKPQDVTVLDPCVGSGHFLVYAFDVLLKIYVEYGYSEREAASEIITHNLFGLDIDERAVQLAYFAVMMKARQYDRRFLTRGIKPHILSITESNDVDSNSIDFFCGNDTTIKNESLVLLDTFRDAKEYGSILQIPYLNLDKLKERLASAKEEISIFGTIAVTQFERLIELADIFRKRFAIVATNPPYLNKFDDKLKNYILQHYNDYSGDLFSVFMYRNFLFCKEKGYSGFMTPNSWLAAKLYEKLRNLIFDDKGISSLVQMAKGAFFKEATVDVCAFVLINEKYLDDGVYVRLEDFKGDMQLQGKKYLEVIKNQDNKYVFSAPIDRFSHIPGKALAYWISENGLNAFGRSLISEYVETKQGLKTGNNDLFLRLWHEVDLNTLFLGNEKKAKRWFPCNKGGDYRKWYGNKEYVVDWANDGERIINYKDEKGKQLSRPQNLSYNFREALTWSTLSSGPISFRYSDCNMMFESKGSGCFPKSCTNNIYTIQGFLNSKVCMYYLAALAPTVDYSEGSILKLPYWNTNSEERVSTIAKSCVSTSKDDWDSFEISWDFKCHPLVKLCHGVDDNNGNEQACIEDAYNEWKFDCDRRFNKLKTNEEELNHIFIDIYGLQGELSPEVDEKDVTVRKADLGRDIRSLISYAVGCMFGRYSLDCEGLAYAGGEWDASKYTTFTADKDNIIPICDDDYFDDDITGRFIKWVETVYGTQTLEENLNFIANALGGKGLPRDVIRNYFLNDFYADHLKIYQKRPIYWLFDSGKKNGFKALIYMHRYQPDTIARMRTDYVHEQQSRYRTAIADLEQRINSASIGDRVKLSKKLQTLQDQASEIRVYEEKIHHLADQMIRIDLDDGVKVNYAKFEDVLAKIK